MKSTGLLIVRLTVGGLLIGHGAQKLFGSFGGNGFQKTAAWMESMKLKPGQVWASAAGAGEFGGGALLALGLLNPIGAAGVIGAMSMATMKAHWGKPIWNTQGGAELPLINGAVATALLMTGPGAISLDRAFNIRLPRWVTFASLAGVAGSLALAKMQEQAINQQEQQQQSAEVTPATRAEIETKAAATTE